MQTQSKQNENACRKRVFVSGCYDMLHSGHVAFFKEASAPFTSALAPTGPSRSSSTGRPCVRSANAFIW